MFHFYTVNTWKVFKFAFFKFAFEDIGLGTKFNLYHETM